MTEPERLLHIADVATWQAAGETYAPDGWEAEAFIHLSGPHQVLTPANRWYRDRSDLVLLVIDEDALTSELRREPGTGTDEIFPHLYGPLNTDAVIRVAPFPCDPDGGFGALPPEIL